MSQTITPVHVQTVRETRSLVKDFHIPNNTVHRVNRRKAKQINIYAGAGAEFNLGDLYTTTYHISKPNMRYLFRPFHERLGEQTDEQLVLISRTYVMLYSIVRIYEIKEKHSQPLAKTSLSGLLYTALVTFVFDEFKARECAAAYDLCLVV
ncbi:hypothetical protein TSAR_010336 [Trichomalopsis sarcophagae]|uniref:Uncharacterized protein n=1 Tax=Trichomalopsis sarcophagae TaxID=543379 RepID=A0A232EFX8_9HYME|nr:hypothetical protein TSAR_010336 [Trichomalopsis sarcophagae]